MTTSMPLLDGAPRHLFFTGKGGVGKTSIACAAAVALADRGHRVLLVSTDPASNLDEVLATPIGPQPTAIPSVPGLSALNLDPIAAATAYRERVVGPYRGKLPPVYLAQMEEQLSGACTVEIAAFDEFARLLGAPDATAGFDHVLFDTAPTGHTLRLLSLPTAWSAFMEDNVSGASCIGPLAGLGAQRALYAESVAVLADGARTLLVLVTRPEGSAIAEAARTAGELRALGVTRQHLVVNGTFRPSVSGDAVADAMVERAREALRSMPPMLAELPRTDVPLRAHALVGVPHLRALLASAGEALDALEPPSAVATASLAHLVDEIAAHPGGVVMTVGKGGVGKTTVAAAIAVELARRGHAVRLTTTDPAAHVAGVIGDARSHLTVERIDPAAETRRYVAEVLATAGAGLDPAGRALLDEDLRSPCTEEVAVFRAFARTVAQGTGGFVIIDTAPTGHTLLLLDAAESYHREVARRSEGSPEEVRALLPRLRDPTYTRAVVVTLPEATPVHEAAALQADLRRAGVEPFAWVINQSLTPVATRDPLLAARRRLEAPFVDEVRTRHATRFALVPWQPTPPVAGALERLLDEPPVTESIRGA